MENHNWVDDVGGLPSTIKRIADHIAKKNPGWDKSRAIASAVNTVKKGCAGDLQFTGKQDPSPETKARYCAAVAEWEAKKARAKADNGYATWARDLLARQPDLQAKLNRFSAP